MATDPRFRGPKGDRGIDGVPGRDGKDGRSPEVDYDRLANEMVKRLPPLRFEIQEAGQTVASQTVPLGGVVKLNLIPVK